MTIKRRRRGEKDGFSRLTRAGGIYIMKDGVVGRREGPFKKIGPFVRNFS